jgi:hypothetical protein
LGFRFELGLGLGLGVGVSIKIRVRLRVTILKAVCWRSSCVLGPHELRTMGSAVPSCSRGVQFQPRTHLCYVRGDT